MARTKNFNEDKVLEQAMLLFWKKGYSATSMKELEKVMALKITSIYNAFGNKRALFEKILDYYLQHVIIKFFESIDNADSPTNALKAILTEAIHLHFNPSNPGGCLIVFSILESEKHSEKSKNFVITALYLLRNAIIKRLEEDKEKGEITPEVDCHSVANHIMALIMGMTTMAKAGFSQEELKRLSNNAAETLLKTETIAS